MSRIIDRRAMVGGLAGGALTLAAQPSIAKALQRPQDFSFTVLGDWGRDTPAQHQVARSLGEAMAEARGAFVLAVGDNFYESGVASVEDPLWRVCFEDVYTHPALQRPWRVALGNHD